ncbi:MAG: helix-turn-helix domain-containing protein, partial [Pseudomonadota bacterium]
RDRLEEIPKLAEVFVEHVSARDGWADRPQLSSEALKIFEGYAWPGNVRELENRIKKAVVMAEKPIITVEDLDIRPEDVEEIVPLSEARERFQIRYINMVLAKNQGNRTKTARDLGVDPRTIFRHLEKLNQPIPPEDEIAHLDDIP